MIIFLIRRYNDIDHVVPIIYRLAKDKFVNFAVLALNPDIDIQNDFRLQFLRNEFGICIEYIYKYNPKGLLWKISGRIFCCSVNRIDFKPWGFVVKYFSRLARRYFSDKWAHKLLKKNDIKLIVLDWQEPGRFVTGELVRAAKIKKIPIIAVPHGVALYSNDSWTTKMVKGQMPVSFGQMHKDYQKVVVQFDHYGQKLIKDGVPKDKIHIQGSARFCKEWEDVYMGLIRQTFPACKNKNGKLKILYFDHEALYRINQHVVLETLLKLSKLDFVELVVKPTTGNQHHKKGGICTPELINNVHLDYETHSVCLIEWADIVMGTTSSILLEVLLMNKIFLYPKFFHENSMLWEDYKACWQVDDYDELKAAVYKVSELSGYRNYSQKDVDRFIDVVVYGDKQNKDVLGEYKCMILETAGYKKKINHQEVKK